MKKILFLFLMAMNSAVWACPNCHSFASEDNKPPYALIILGIFVLAIYIPFYLMLSAAKKYDPKTIEGSDGNE